MHPHCVNITVTNGNEVIYTVKFLVLCMKARTSSIHIKDISVETCDDFLRTILNPTVAVLSVLHALYGDDPCKEMENLPEHVSLTVSLEEFISYYIDYISKNNGNSHINKLYLAPAVFGNSDELHRYLDTISRMKLPDSYRLVFKCVSKIISRLGAKTCEVESVTVRPFTSETEKIVYALSHYLLAKTGSVSGGIL